MDYFFFTALLFLFHHRLSNTVLAVREERVYMCKSNTGREGGREGGREREREGGREREGERGREGERERGREGERERETYL